MKQKKTIHIIAMATLAAIIFGLAWAEQITFTTYYPSPYGVYKEFTTTSKTTLATNSELTDPEAKVGIGTDTPTEKLDVSGEIHATGDVCTDQGGGVCLSTAGGGGWQHSGVQIFDDVLAPTGVWQDIDLSPYGVTKRTLVLLKIKRQDWKTINVAVRPNGDDGEYLSFSPDFSGGTAVIEIGMRRDFEAGTLLIQTDDSGVIEWTSIIPLNGPLDLWLLGYVK